MSVMQLKLADYEVKKRLAQTKLDDLYVQVGLQLEPFDLKRLEPEHGSALFQFRLPLRLTEDQKVEFKLNFPLRVKKHFKSCGGRGFHAKLVFRLPSSSDKNAFARLSCSAFCDKLVTKEVTEICFFDESGDNWIAQFSFDKNDYLDTCSFDYKPKNHFSMISLFSNYIFNETAIFSK